MLKGINPRFWLGINSSRKTKQKHRVMIVEKLLQKGDATCSELEQMLNLTHQTVSARICELVKDKVIVDTGKKRLTPSLRPSRVYKINE